MKHIPFLLGVSVACLLAGCAQDTPDPLPVNPTATVVIDLQRLPRGAELGPASIEPVASDVGMLMTADWLSELTAQARSACRNNAAVANGKQPVRVVGRVIHFETPGVTSASADKSEIIVRVRCESDGRVIGRANIVSRTDSTRPTLQQDLIGAFAGGVARWLSGVAAPGN
jgi:hypothetical protein